MENAPLAEPAPPYPHQHRMRRPGLRSGTRAASPALLLLAALWLVTLFDPQWLLAARGVRAGLKAPVFLFPALGLTLAFGLLTVKEIARRWTWYPPLLFFILTAVASTAFTVNMGRSRVIVQGLLLYWTLVVGTAVLVNTARRAELLLTAFALQFLWFGVWGASSGRVFWNPVLANLDGFGAWMVVGGGMCAFLALSSKDRWFRRTMMLTLALCAIGVVASFARGAFLSGMAVAGVVWLRSPRKGRALAAGIGLCLVVVAAASLLHGAAYWAEMKTIALGTGESTGEDRWEMWKAAFEVFLARPILGAGPDNWGAFAASYFRPGELGGRYTGNPAMLYGRSAHSSYIQILAEQGIVGVIAFGWILIDFWRRNALLRTNAAAQLWRQLGGRLDLRTVALGLEAALVGWMGAAAFYSLSGAHWLYTLLALNLLLHTLVKGAARVPSFGRGRERRVPLRRPQLAGAAFPPVERGPWRAPPG